MNLLALDSGRGPPLFCEGRRLRPVVLFSDSVGEWCSVFEGGLPFVVPFAAFAALAPPAPDAAAFAAGAFAAGFAPAAGAPALEF